MLVSRGWLTCALFLAACGGATDSDLFGSPPANQQQPDASTSADATTSNDASVSDATQPPPAQDSSTTVDANQPDTSTPAASKIHCGNTDCNSTTESCCRSATSGSSYSYACTNDPNTSCQGLGDIVIECSNAQNCADQGNAGDVCCATRNGPGGSVDGTTCMSASQCGQMGGVIACDPNAANNCPNGGGCKTSSVTLPTYNLCF